MNDKTITAKCFICGANLIHKDDFSVSDVYSEYDGDDEAIGMIYQCPTCGCDYEVVMPTKQEREVDYKEYYNNG